MTTANRKDTGMAEAATETGRNTRVNDLKTRADVEERYNVNAHGLIADQGRFEGQIWWAPLAEQVAGYGDGEELTANGREITAIAIRDEERQEWQLNGATTHVMVEEDEHGCIEVWEADEAAVTRIEKKTYQR